MADRDKNGRFLAGHSIRPKNRKPPPTRQEVRAIRELVLEKIGGEAGLMEMVGAMQQAVSEGNVRAFDSLLDRIYGKVVQPLDVGLKLPAEVKEILED